MPTRGGSWWRHPRGGDPAVLRVKIVTPHGAPLSFDAVRAPARDHANGVRVYVCELPGAVFRNLPHSSIDFPVLPGMWEISFIEADGGAK